MKNVLIIFAAGGLMFIVGFAVGGFSQKVRNGYQYRLLEEKDYASPLGPVKWSCFMESVGTPFLDSEKTMITVGNRTVYKAQRDFQEDNPSAKNIKVSDKSIAWDDGDYRYNLTMEEMANDAPDAVKSSQPPLQAQ